MGWACLHQAGMTVSGWLRLACIYPPAQVDASAQREKQAFLNQPGDVTGSSDDLQATLRDPSSPYLVMAGTAIPAVMVGGINSDMPGMVIGQVAQNVYDTATGRLLLIPQGARLIGSYDNMVSNGSDPCRRDLEPRSSIPTPNRSTSARWRVRTRAATPASMTR